ncbi:general transcription factor IIIA, b [Polypterus senegalus]|uniref:general transcription factor IIIA, b n=1 Tax=Polypterus senegalus TaxID=55291 RepID=UPI001962711D|nr:general transcription factor IIIA, b [Polypterus senegalus]
MMVGESLVFNGRNTCVFPLPLAEMGEKRVSDKKYFCSFEGCNATFNKNWKLEAHICNHTGLRPFVCQYEGCTKSFTRNFHLIRHQLTHTGEKPFRCTSEGCTQAFSTNSNLKKHIARKHENQGQQYTCAHEGCGKVFKKNSQLKAHEFEHTNILPYKCNSDGCLKNFASLSKLKRHEKVHKGYACEKDDCEFVGKTWTEYLKHRNGSHQELIQCKQCPKTFKKLWFLELHQKIHLEERLVFRCPKADCDRTYTTHFNLQSHILTFHEEQRPFKCEHPGCEKTFAMKQSLERHHVKHDPEKQKLKKRTRPKRSLVSHLSGFRPPKNKDVSPCEPLPGDLQEMVEKNGIENQVQPII